MVTNYTVTQYEQETQRRLGDMSFNGSMLLKFAEDVNRDICNSQPWPFMEKWFDGAITIGDIYYDLNASVTDLQVPINFQLTSPNASAGHMRYFPHQKFSRDYPDPTALTRARPWLWSYFGSTLIVGPAPADQAYTFRLGYIKEPVTVASDTDVLDVPNSFREVVVLGMYSRALYSNDEFNKAQIVEQDYDIALQKMVRRLSMRQLGQPTEMGSGRTRHHDIDDEAMFYPW